MPDIPDELSEDALTELIQREAIPTCQYDEKEGFPYAELPDWRARNTAKAILELIRKVKR